MFAHIEGRVCEKGAGELVIDAGGVGYLLLCPGSTVANAPAKGEVMRCYTHLSVRDDAMELFGFATRDEREMFRRLGTVSGIGPRTALGILSALSVRDLTLALLTGDAAMLARAPGVGRKTAQRLILELKDKIEQQDLDIADGVRPIPENADITVEAVQALMALGYTGVEANRAVSAVRDRAVTVDALILMALKGLGG
ncbi:MAG: Holliday junction branch migration protein RuvA [Clostridia bacterium]|nr:Holliday junction branch migration protein RuvA [Clostridia bacterium]